MARLQTPVTGFAWARKYDCIQSRPPPPTDLYVFFPGRSTVASDPSTSPLTSPLCVSSPTTAGSASSGRGRLRGNHRRELIEPPNPVLALAPSG